MKIELEVTAHAAQGIVEYLTQNNDVNKMTDCLHRIINVLYTKMSQQENETEEFRAIIETFLVHDTYPVSPDPETDPFLYDEEEEIG